MLQDVERAWKVSEAAFFSKWNELLESSNQRSFSSKTCLQSAPVEARQWGKDWPRSGMIVGGIIYPLPMSERLTNENGGFCLLPTPTASQYGTCVGGAAGRTGRVRASLNTMARSGLWPTPTCQDANGRTHHNQKNGSIILSLLGTVMLNPNPETRIWATPTARDWKSGKASAATHAKNSRPLSEQTGGSLNPDWVEILMGYDRGWTLLGKKEFQELLLQRRGASKGSTGSVTPSSQPKRAKRSKD